MSEKKITVHNCIKCDQNEVYWNVKNSAWYCSTCGFYRGEKLEMVKPIKMSNLPPELVEKMQKYILKHYPDIIPGDKLRTLSFECAQIAVQYSEEENTHMFNAVQLLANKLQKIEKQRDELLEALRESKTEIIKLKDHYHDVGHGLKHLMKIEQLLKKHEDGK